MNTTALFVELVIIGSGVIIWLGLLILSLFDYTWVPWKELTSIVVLVPSVSLIYILGVVGDRVSDQIFSKWDKSLRSKYFSSNKEYHNARTYTYTHATTIIINLFEYGRSRLRLSRAWTVNFLLLGISSSIFACLKLTLPISTLVLIVAFCIVLFGTCSIVTFYAWRKLAENDYKRLFETFEFLQGEKSDD